jgi:vacuolar protein sorting-associated protein 13A/C
MVVTFASKQRLDLNIGTTFVELVIGMSESWSESQQRILKKARGGDAPYRIRNLTGSVLNIWSDFDGSHQAKQPATTKVGNGESADWRFDDWRAMREVGWQFVKCLGVLINNQSTSSGNNNIGIQFIGKPWEQLRSVGIDTVGEYTYALRPRVEKIADRLLCEVSIQGSVKIVTLRSTYKIVNRTMYTVELTLVDEKGQPVYGVERLGTWCNRCHGHWN